MYIDIANWVRIYYLPHGPVPGTYRFAILCQIWIRWIHLYVPYIYIHLEPKMDPNDPCFGWKKALFCGVDLWKNGKLGSSYILITSDFSTVYLVFIAFQVILPETNSKNTWTWILLLMVQKSGVYQLRLVYFIPCIYKVLYIQTVVGNGISEASTVVSFWGRLGLFSVAFCC